MNSTLNITSEELFSLKKTLLKKDQEIVGKDQEITVLKQRIEQFEEHFRLSRHQRFGASSEKHSGQGELFNEAETLLDTEDASESSDTETSLTDATPNVAKTPKRKPGRKPLPEGLPRERVVHDLPDNEKTCECGCQLTPIGEETSEQLEIVPAQIRVIVNVRKKYACRRCEQGVALTPLPPQPIPKSMVTAAMLAWIVVSKYQDALPLHRLEGIIARMGVDLPRSTLARWMIQAGALVTPLLNLLQDTLLEGPLIHMDETSLQVHNEPGKPPESRSYMWVRAAFLPDKKIVLYHYAPGRGGHVAAELLAGYSGYLQTDDYAGYNAVCASEAITQLGCWAHARRKFVEAQKANTNQGKKVIGSMAGMALKWIGELYAIERRIKGLSTEERYAVRQQESVPILNQLRRWCDDTLHKILPKGLLGKALGYMNRYWDKLTVYTQDGGLNIDNNPAENAIRPFVIGRKNWLFSDTPKGAQASAQLYSLIETTKANGLEPFSYLSHVFKELPAADTVEKIEALLPWNVDGGTIEAGYSTG
jgi:transposase